MATKLQSLKIGDADSNYNNGNLDSLTLGNNVLLKTIDIRNCTAFGTGEQQSLDISGCTNVEHVYLTGTALKGISLPSGGVLKTLHLPDTVTNLTIRNQPSLTDFVLNDSSKLTTLRLENVGAIIDTPSVINAMADGSRIRALDIDWEVDSEDDLTALLNKLIKMRGLDENGNNLDAAVLTGRIRVKEKVSDEIVGNFYNHFADVVIDDGSSEIYIINYKDRDGKILYTARVSEGANAIDPIEEGYIEKPEAIITETYRYEFVGWSMLPTNINRHYIIIATYHTKFAIKFYNGDEHIYSQWSIQGDAATDPVATGAIPTPTKTGTADKSYKFSGWDNLPTNVQSSISVHAQFDTYWAARFNNDNKIHVLEWVLDGANVISPEDYFEDYVDPVRTSTAQYDYVFTSWSGDFDTPMNSARDFSAEYRSVLRKYNVYFYNDNQLLYTVENVPYGSSATYKGATPTKLGVEYPEDYVFRGWTPMPEEITGETECRAFFKYTGYLFGRLGKTEDEATEFGTVDHPNWNAINLYWDVIAADTQSYKEGTMSEEEFKTKYPIGGRMLAMIEDYYYGTTQFGADMEIIGYNHDDLSDGSGKAALTFFCLDLPRISHAMNETSTNSGGYKNSSMREFVNEELFGRLPSGLRNIIKQVDKISDGGSNNQSLVTTSDKCWIASYDEVGFPEISGSIPGQGAVYSDIFSVNKESRVKYLDNSAEEGRWWLRSSDYSSSSSNMFWRVQTSGAVYGDISSNKYYVAFGFCI
jgi:hypothetical protein